jgi:transcription-repair coupling factor (superfamily II helicase)
MLTSILNTFRHHPAVQRVSDTLDRDRRVPVHGLGGSSDAFLAAVLVGDTVDAPERRVLVVCPDDESATTFRDDASAILGPERVSHFPERDTEPYERTDSHFEVRSQRIETLDRLSRGWKGVIVTSAAAVLDPTTPPGLVELAAAEVTVGDDLEFNAFLRSLIAAGFKRTAAVSAAGEISVRGGIIDIFPFGGDLPYRVEFWGDAVESIRTFSTATQRSIDTVERFLIIPPDECITAAGLGSAERERIADIERETGISLNHIIEAFDDGERIDGLEQYLYTVFGPDALLPAHLTDDDIVMIIDPPHVTHAVEARLDHAATMRERHLADDTDLPPVTRLFPDEPTFSDALSRIPTVSVYALRAPGTSPIEFDIISSRQYDGSIDDLVKDITDHRTAGRACSILCDNTGQMDRLRELLGGTVDDVRTEVAILAGGFTAPGADCAVFTDHEIFSRHRRRVRYRRYKEGVPIPDHRVLTLGEFVVHVEYGIGRYMGVRRQAIGGAETDCLLIHYRGGDELLIPSGQLDKLKKFSSEEGVVPVVTKLGGTAWEKVKARTRTAIQRMARDLLKLYAERKAFSGTRFVADEEMLRSFVDSFIYEDTPDQRQTWQDVRSDMEQPIPMERFICGDVGFGKTEIAMRAAFLAVLNSKQVAILVPTTILAEQHGETFRERFADFPVRVESLSRFRSQKQQKDILDRLSRGEVDIVIGTHRLISRDVHIHDLGLLIIDEEQRFGVRAKERLRTMKKNVDTLSMSATPIPRTLNMSLLGARDISYITTPPHDRLAVHTEIVPFEEKYVVEAILREIDRDGQVFFVHNRVRSIESIAEYLRRLMPTVSFAVAHGQLSERQLEKVMDDFHHRKYQVLVTSMIIENGLDMPSVNTILINRADTFGLSQLYQLRGRVGRSSRRAFAHLLTPPRMALSRIAQKRLRTIEEFVSLGSGFNIAMRDLEIRGAGNILGTEQSGFISAVGFDLYMDLLKETIAELTGEEVPRPPEVEVHSPWDAYLPETYVPDPGERVLLYRRLAGTISTKEVTAIEEEMSDRYGRPHDAVTTLIDCAFIRHAAAAISADDVTIGDEKTVIHVPVGIEVTREQVEKLVKRSPVRLNFTFGDGMDVSFIPPDTGDRHLASVKKVLQALHG